MDTVMELQDVWKVYRMDEFDVPALQGIDLAIEASEFVAIQDLADAGSQPC